MTRAAWWMTGGGLAGALLSVPLGLFYDGLGWMVAWMFFTVISGLVFVGGVVMLARRGVWLMVLAFIIGTLAPLIWATSVHAFVLHKYAGVERCGVTNAVENHKTTDKGRPDSDFDYVIACPSGTLVRQNVESHRQLGSDTVDVYQLPPVRPELVRDNYYESWVLWGAPLAIVALLGLAIAIRRHDYLTAVRRSSRAVRKRPSP